MATVTKAQVLDALRTVNEPKQERDVVSLNLVKDVSVNEGTVRFTLVLDRSIASFKAQIQMAAREAAGAIPGVTTVEIDVERPVVADPNLMSRTELGVRNAVAIASGKGGVGKSTMSTNIAIGLALDGARVGLLDVDVYGPNVPIMMGVEGQPKGRGNKIIPPEGHGIKLMSMGFLVEPEEPIIWRGPMLHNAIRQFINDVEWGDLDYLIVDLPPGTGDASLSLAQSLGLTGAVIVTTPQRVAISDVIRSVAMFQQLSVPVLGVIENMSYFVAPDTGKRYDIFGNGGGSDMAKKLNLEFMGGVPIESEVRMGGDEGTPIVVRDPESAAAKAIRQVARRVAEVVEAKNLAEGAEGSQKDPVLSVID